MNTSTHVSGRSSHVVGFPWKPIGVALISMVAMTSIMYVAPLTAQKKKPAVKKTKLPSFATLLRGRRVFEKNCVQCHGGRGTGDGPQGRGLKPPPANLTRSKMKRSAKAKIITGGGISVGRSSGMPSWNKALTPNEIQDLVNYLMVITPYAPGAKKKSKR